MIINIYNVFRIFDKMYTDNNYKDNSKNFFTLELSNFRKWDKC